MKRIHYRFLLVVDWKKGKLICSLVDWMAEASAEQACCPRMNNVPLSQTVYIVFRLRPGNLHVSNKLITNFVNHNKIIRFLGLEQ